MAIAAPVKEKAYEIGERVVYKAQFNDPGHYKPDDLLPGEVICRYKNGGRFTYRIRLDMKWSDRVATPGKPIIVGNVSGERIAREEG